MSNVVPPVSATIAVSVPPSACAYRRPAIGAIEGPDPIAWMGARVISATSITPPPEVSISSRPVNPDPSRRDSRLARYRDMSGFSEASIAVDDARRYSRRIGFRTCDSVYGTPGRCSARSSPTRRSCAGLTVDHSSETATDSTSSCLRVAVKSITARSSRASTSPPAASIRPGTSKVSARGT